MEFTDIKMTTRQCSLTKVTEPDRPAFIRLVTDPRARRYLGGPKSNTAARRQFDAIVESRPGETHWDVRPAHDGVFVGIVSLTPHHDGVDTEITYRFLPDHWGNGYATESVQAVVEHAPADMGAHRLIAETQESNTESRRLLQRFGFKADRTLMRFGAEQVIYASPGQ